MKTKAEPNPLSDEQHLTCAKSLFNYTWTLLDRSDRTPDDDERMLAAVHAQLHHWLQVGEPVNFARGHWQIARVYCVLGRPEPAAYHARRCLDICEENGLSAFDHAAAHEALARAHAAAGEHEASVAHVERAREAAKRITDEESLQIIEADLTTVGGR